MITLLKQFWCGLHGHQIFLHYAPSKLSLKCELCQHESDGWEIKPPPLRPLPVVTTARPVLVFRRRA